MKKNKEGTNSFLTRLGFFLNRNLGLHLLLSFVINILVIIVIIGLYSALKYPILSYELSGLIIFVSITTLLETMLFIFLVRFLMKIVVKSKGLVIILGEGLIFYLATLIFKDVSFRPLVIVKLLIFTLSFVILKVITIIIIQRYTLQDRGEKR